VARVPTLIDGERVKKTYELGTTDRAVARRKLARIVAELGAGTAIAADAAKPTETLEQYAKSWLKESPENRGIPERDTGLEPVTPSLGSSCSTN
jgi:hypothetical protein